MNSMKRIIALHHRILSNHSTSSKFNACSEYYFRRSFLFNFNLHISNSFSSCTVRRYQVTKSQAPQEGVVSFSENSRPNSVYKYIDDLSSLDDDQLLNIIELVNNSRNSDNPITGGKKLDDECIKRTEKWNSDEVLKFLKRYHSIGKHSKSKFVKYAIKHKFEEIINGPLRNIIDYFQIIDERDAWYRAPFSGHEVEYILTKYLPELQWTDIELLLKPLNFYKKFITTNELLEALCNKFLNEINNIPPPVIRTFFILMENQGVSQIKPEFTFQKLHRSVKILSEKFNCFDLHTVSQIASFCQRMSMFDPFVLQRIASRTIDSLDEPSTNLEMLEKILGSLTYFNYNSSDNEIDFYLGITTALKSESLVCENESERQTFIRILGHLSIVNVYPIDLISKALDRQFLKQAYRNISRVNVPYEVRLLISGAKYDNVSIDSNYLNMNDLTLDVERNLIKFPKILLRHDYSDPQDSHSIRFLSPYNRVLHDIQALLDEIFGGVEYTHICYRYVHFTRANIYFRMDKKGSPRKLHENIRKRLFYKRDKFSTLPKYVSEYMVVLKNRSRFIDYEHMLLGEEIAKVRHLTNDGFKVITLPQQGWFNMKIHERKEVLRNAINDCIRAEQPKQ